MEGRPAPKGSKSVGQHGQVYEQSPHVTLWTETVAMNCLRYTRNRIPAEIAVGVDLVFYMQRAWRTPDGDKLMRATFDGLVDGSLLVDDKYIVRGSFRRIREADEFARFGCLISVTREDERW